ncbi:MAG TPA: hypothetical protein VFY68_17975 [Nitrososphaeraceae archaeon]|nr:hypothetical protein [Nitrososphaeraceae archaeon]
MSKFLSKYDPNADNIPFLIISDRTNITIKLVNIFQSDFVVCNVDHMYNGAFEANCNKDKAARRR